MVRKITVPTKVERSFHGLREALFDELDALRENRTKPERANATARIASEICRSVNTQLALLQHQSTTPDEETTKGLLK